MSNAGGSENGVGDPLCRNGDRLFPVRCINRLVKKALPPDSQIGRDASEAVNICASEFICFITSEAFDRCRREDRKTISGDDLLWAMASLGFEDYISPLKTYLFKYRKLSSGSPVSGKGRYTQEGRNVKSRVGSSSLQELSHPPYIDEIGYMEPWSDGEVLKQRHPKRGL